MSLNLIIFDWLRNPSVFVPFNLIFNLKLILDTFLPISRFPCCLLSYVCCLLSVLLCAVYCLTGCLLSVVLCAVFCALSVVFCIVFCLLSFVLSVVCCLLVLVYQVIYMKYLLTRPRRGYGTKDTTEKNWIRELNTLSKEEEEVVVVVITEEEEEEASVVSISRLLAYY